MPRCYNFQFQLVEFEIVFPISLELINENCRQIQVVKPVKICLFYYNFYHMPSRNPIL